MQKKYEFLNWKSEDATLPAEFVVPQGNVDFLKW